MGAPMLDPERDLKGATPETLARALFRRRFVKKGKSADRVRERQDDYEPGSEEDPEQALPRPAQDDRRK